MLLYYCRKADILALGRSALIAVDKRAFKESQTNSIAGIGLCPSVSAVGVPFPQKGG